MTPDTANKLIPPSLPPRERDPVDGLVVKDIGEARYARRKREKEIHEFAIAEFRRFRANENLQSETIDDDERAVRLLFDATGKYFWQLKDEHDLQPFVTRLANNPRSKRKATKATILGKAKQFMDFVSSDDTLLDMVREEFGETIVQPFKTKIMLTFRGKDDARKRKAITQANLELLFTTMKRMIRKASSRDRDPRRNVFLPLVRDLVLIFVVYALGLRISEVLGLTLESVGKRRFCLSSNDLGRAEISNGKGSKGGGKKAKTLPLVHRELPTLLSLYLANIRPKLLGPGREDEKILFPSISGMPMTAAHLDDRFKKFLGKAGLAEEHYVVHSLRRAFITHIRMTQPGKVVQELARHGDIRITDSYTDFPQEYVADKCGTYIDKTVAWALSGQRRNG